MKNFIFLIIMFEEIKGAIYLSTIILQKATTYLEKNKASTHGSFVF